MKRLAVLGSRRQEGIARLERRFCRKLQVNLLPPGESDFMLEAVANREKKKKGLPILFMDLRDIITRWRHC